MPTTLTYAPGAISKQLKDLVTGLTALPPQAVTSLLVNGKTYTMPELLAALSGYAAKYKATDEAYDAFRAALEWPRRAGRGLLRDEHRQGVDHSHGVQDRRLGQ